MKSQCVNQNCYDRKNFASTFKKGSSCSYKNLEVGERIELSGAGIKEAEALLATLASGAA